jgi:hypothetical protein
MNTVIKKASTKIAERLCWCTARKDQEGITRDLSQGKDIPEVYGLGEAGLFDEFFCFLDEFKISDLFSLLMPPPKKRGSNVIFSTVLLIYVMRIVGGLAFFWHIGPTLLRSQPLMRLVGFNGREVRKGTSRRGPKKTNGKKPPEEDPDFIRGPVCPESIAEHVVTISATGLERFFNAVIAILAGNSFFPKKIHGLLDASEIETTQKCEGCGKVSKEKAPALRLRKGRIRKVMETVFGFKIWVVWDSTSRLPLAMRFATIEVPDVQMAREVVHQALRNIEGHAKLFSLAFDRGFIDGKFMWWLNGEGVQFYVPARKDMNVYKDALSLIDKGKRDRRQRSRMVGSGKNRQKVVDYWDVTGIEGLTSAGFYGELGSGSHEHSKSFVANPINAVVVLDDPYRRNNPGCELMVILTNADLKKPMKVYDGYDRRSEIENGLFREAKQGWFIQRPARNTAAAYRVHVYLTILVMALTETFRTWMDAQEEIEKQGEDTGIRRFRERVREENGNKLIVFDEGRYAIYDTYEVFILCGRNVRKPRGVVETITKDEILIKYGVSLK